MSTTTDHPRARIVQLTLAEVAAACLTDWREDYGIPEVLRASTDHDAYTHILCERTLKGAGVDVFWNDLVCTTKEQAAAAVMAVAERGVDLEALYGPNYAALLGILEGAVLMGSSEIASLGYQLHGGGYSALYEAAYTHGRYLGVDRLVDRVLSDVQIACHKREIHSPSALQRHLLGVRAMELTAMYYVLKGAGAEMTEEFEVRLTQPMRAYLFPREPYL